MPVLRTPALRKSLSVALMTLGLALPAAGQGADDLFTVRGIDVDVSAGSPSAARDQGVREAQRKAFDQLFDRLTVDGARTAMPPVTNESIDRMVQSYEVQEERTSAVRYVGKLAVRFNPTAVRTLLRGNGVAFAEVRSKPLLVLPVDQTSGVPVLWQSETIWRQTWADLPAQGGLVPLAVPYGEAADVADIGVDQALSGDAAALRRIADRYGAGDVAVAVATGSPQVGLTIAVTLHAADGSAQHFTLTQAPVAADTATTGNQPDPTLRAAALAVLHLAEERWTSLTQVSAGTEQNLTLTVSFADQAGWQEVRRRLGTIPTITRMAVTSLSRAGATLDLRHTGTPEQLRLALGQRDLTLEDGGETPVLRLAR